MNTLHQIKFSNVDNIEYLNKKKIYFDMKINFLHVWLVLEETDGTTAIHECESSIETSMQKKQKK